MCDNAEFVHQSKDANNFAYLLLLTSFSYIYTLRIGVCVYCVSIRKKRQIRKKTCCIKIFTVELLLEIDVDASSQGKRASNVPCVSLPNVFLDKKWYANVFKVMYFCSYKMRV